MMSATTTIPSCHVTWTTTTTVTPEAGAWGPATANAGLSQANKGQQRPVTVNAGPSPQHPVMVKKGLNDGLSIVWATTTRYHHHHPCFHPNTHFSTTTTCFSTTVTPLPFFSPSSLVFAPPPPPAFSPHHLFFIPLLVFVPPCYHHPFFTTTTRFSPQLPFFGFFYLFIISF